ncbi:hypothetical protein [Runella rosea]|uniref:hypothetical protein n=1 Tax=Runella rosea TaxID=2259595 RepID=UPI0013B408F6|nr:hypothetical protein [Runella rosea]
MGKGNYAVGSNGHEGTLQFLSGMLTQSANSKITGGSFVIDIKYNDLTSNFVEITQ